MLKLKPNCEICDCDLPADSNKARICSYECTFCSDCDDVLLKNVCPNCGGDLVPRPIRPENEWRTQTSLIHQPASQERVHGKYSRENIVAFVAKVLANRKEGT